MTKTPVAIVGATGYTGLEILKILLRHPRAELASLTAKVDGTIKIQDEFPVLQGTVDMDCSPVNTEEVCRKAEIIFLSLPHTVSMRFAPAFLRAGKKVIDLSADYRFPRKEDFESWYGAPHADPEGLAQAVYGLPELFREKIKTARLIANPGCFPTGAILSIYPAAQAGLLAAPEAIIDAKSGVTGAGRKASLALLFPEVNENFKAYSLTSHKHTPEIAGVLSAALRREMKVEFAPHLLPVNRGILSTIYLKLAAASSEEAVLDIYRRQYGNEPFIRVYPKGTLPQLREAVGTNNCLIGLKVNPRTGNLILVAVIDNLLKGAAGQAVQNMNIMQGWEESAGLN
jgi:N-acetyl-gamma-glutamyl-phosphate reductase